MKKAIYIIAFTLVTMTANAQITLENSYASANLKIVNLSVSGYKYSYSDINLNQIKLYNLNHSLWKTINLFIPVGGGTADLSNYTVSEKLFNSDNLIEVSYNVQIVSFTDSLYVINETGSIIFRTTAFIGDYQIINDGMNFKMRVTRPSGTQDIYSLPGTLPCNMCGGFTGIAVQNSNDNSQMISNPFPNPTSDRTTINYELPEGINQGRLVFYDVTGSVVKEFNVDSSFKDLQVSNSDLSAGTYYYQLQTIKGTSGGKKLVVVK